MRYLYDKPVQEASAWLRSRDVFTLRRKDQTGNKPLSLLQETNLVCHRFISMTLRSTPVHEALEHACFTYCSWINLFNCILMLIQFIKLLRICVPELNLVWILRTYQPTTN